MFEKHSLDRAEVADLELDAGFVEEGVDMGRKGEVEGEILLEELGAALGHAKADAFEHAAFLIEVEFEVGLADNFWGPDLFDVAVEDGDGVAIAEGL